MKIGRRAFLGTAAAMPALAGIPNLAAVKTRKAAKWEIAYKTPHSHPNGLCLTSEGLWVQDQGEESWMSLINPADGKLIREFKVDFDKASGVCVDDENVMWVTSTYNRLIVSCSAVDGKTIAKRWTPGSGIIYRRKDDPPGRSTKLQPAYPSEARPRGPRRVDLPYGQVPLDAKEAAAGTGAHGIVYKDGLLYYANPPA